MKSEFLIARAGGGQNYSSSSSSSSSGSSSSGSSSYSGGSSGLLGLGFGGLIFIVVVGMVIFARFKKKGKGEDFKKNLDIGKLVQNPLGELFEAATETAIGKTADGVTGQTANTVESGLAQIKQTDPEFNEQIFKDKAQNAFFKIQEAWEKQEINIARPFVSDSIMQRYTTQISDLKSRGEKNVLENIVIGNMDIVDVKNDNAFNYIKLQINASCADYTVDSQGKMISGSKNNEGFTEFWTFIRTVAAKTDANKQLKDNKCPNCGAPLEVNATGQCNYCSAVVSSGQYDWVLSQIDQAE